MTIFQIILCVFFWFTAAFMNGITSFGGNLVGTPLTMLLIGPREAIIFGACVGMVVTGSVTIIYFRNLPRTETILASIGYLIGIPGGIAILRWAPASILMFLAGSCIILFLLWQAVLKRMHTNGVRRSINVPIWCIFPTSVIAGILYGSTSMGGPPMAIYGFLRGWQKETMISVLNTTATIGASFMLILLLMRGDFPQELFLPFGLSVPAIVLGTLLSVPVLRRIKPDLFRKMLLTMLTFSAITLIVRGFMA